MQQWLLSYYQQFLATPKVTQPVDLRKKKFYNEYLKDDLGDLLDYNDLIISDDGFVMSRRSLAELLIEKGIEQYGSQNVNQMYDDWYLYAIVKDGMVSYSFIKMREQENDYRNGVSDRDAPSTSISFRAFDIDRLLNVDSDQDAFFDAFGRTIYADSAQPYHSTLQQYFNDPKSKGSYLLADEYVSFIANHPQNTSTSDGITIAIPDEMNTKENSKDKRLPDFLVKNNNDAGYVIYDKENGVIKIKDPGNLTEYEKRAILATHTGNVNSYSFAAENTYHARALDDWKMIFSKWEQSAIVSDTGVLEENYTGKDTYHNLDSDWVQEQKKENSGWW